MKLKNSYWLGQTEGETIATFGAARLVKKLSGKIELIGGTARDHADARDWCSLFAPEIIFAAGVRPQELSEVVPPARPGIAYAA